jgi:hypothetical protein
LHETLASKIVTRNGTRMAGLATVHFPIIYRLACDFRIDLASPVMKRAERPTLCLIGYELRRKLRCRVSPVRCRAVEILRPPAKKSVNENDVR